MKTIGKELNFSTHVMSRQIHLASKDIHDGQWRVLGSNSIFKQAVTFLKFQIKKYGCTNKSPNWKAINILSFGLLVS
jgi:hypothetical protein